MSEIKPALTAEEWDAAIHRRDLAYFAETEDVSDHGKAALALHGQPFGFTWADVDGIRNQARLMHVAAHLPGPRSNGDQERGAAHWYESLADRIAALLPPREG